MSFIVRKLARTADGREIVRSKSFNRPQLTVGRGTESDIHLPDLAVTLHHAMIRLVGNGQVEISATAGLPIVVDGNQTEHVTVNAISGADVRIGSHDIRVSAGEGDEAGQVILTVERVGAISNSSEAKEEAKVFSLASVIPGKRPLAWTFVIAILAIFLAWPLVASFSRAEPEAGAARAKSFHADQMWSSGALSQVHKGLENDCRACHVNGGSSVKDEACAACHTAVHDHADPARLQVAMGKGGIETRFKRVANGLFNRPPGRCVECHTEHEGATAMPATDERFCTNCHKDMKGRLTDTKLADAADFGDDHPQFMPTLRMVSAAGVPSAARVSLDGKPTENNGLKFPHDIHLSATNGVAQMAKMLGKGEGYGQPLACANCHRRDATGSSFVAVDMEADCQACHSLDFDAVGGTIRTLRHGDPAQVVADIRAFYSSGGQYRAAATQGMDRRRPGAFANRAVAVNYAQGQVARGGTADSAIRAVFSPGGACFDCHVIKPTGDARTPFAVAPVVLTKRYMMKGWFDHAAHDTEKCESCHAVKTSKLSSDVNLPKIARCQDCHGGQDAHKQVPSSCAMCHDYHRNDFAPLMVRSGKVRGKAAQRLDDKSNEKASGS
ncbi:cytochrome c3 family protein [Sphingomonas crocodyli]|uniref:Cytochrome C n=1 Tax=Sphingomonas crocodyli TaxID=1979270 RepID=A0A437MA41_9SPHN|nr:cytochrome c3 family protein [Sphingomonas crocodyli]RVT94498.1 cytochrome C [Sphingomonas crocodyli]